ncbi:hypothetical protein CYMTET_30880 [Cymbomonas tetramitiformis]|uniref:diacylglycerol O-acyltransferase n=1 Tax=Cymbomonas tetramitiformis TaxID=36881 RepID=A0AAE0KTI0_9CHLO|nr:hypothetical protein CYMTET_30880 [Cymbomonas tetramitiformis]
MAETDLFEVGSSKGWTARMQNTMKKCLGFTLPLFMGRGIWLTSGLLPLNKPVHVVVGKPIDCPKVENPTSAQVEEYHEKYIEALIEVFNANKKNVGINRMGELRIG